MITLPKNSKSPAASRHTGLPLASLLALALPLSAGAASLYWDLNGATPNAGTSATGVWNGTNAFWNTDSTGTGGTPQATTSSSDDLFFSSGSNYTTGTVTFSGAVAANSVTFEEGAIALAGTATPSLTLGAGGLTFASGVGATAIGAPLVLGADSTFTQNSAANHTITGAITGASAGVKLTSGGTGSGTVTISGIIGTNIGGITQNNANSTLILTGGSTTTVLNGNTYTGTTTLNAGVLQGRNVTQSVTDNFNAFGTSALVLNGGTLQLRANGGAVSGRTIVGTNAVTIGDNAVTIDVNRNSGTYNNNSIGFSGPLSLGSGQVNTTGANGYSVRFAGTTTLTGNATLNPTTANLDFAGAIGDGGNGYSITKIGSGLLTLRVANTYSGGTNINEGTLQVANAGALGSTGTISFGGGTLQYANSVTTDFSARFSNAANQAYSVNTNGLNVTWASALSSSGGSLTKNGTGTLALNGANSYTGTTTLNQGVITVGAAGALGGSTGNLVVNNTNVGAGNNVVLNLSTGSNTTKGSLSGTIATPTSGTNTATINTQTGRTFTVNQTSDGTFQGVIAGAGNFTLGASSTNTLTLSGNNTFTGSLSVAGGKLNVVGSGAINGTSGITISGGDLSYNSSVALSKPVTLNSGLLSGTGSFSGAITANGGLITSTGTAGAVTLNSGAGINPNGAGVAGTFNAASLVWNSDNTVSGLRFDLGATQEASDSIALSGAFTKGSGSTFVFDFTDAGASPSITYTLLSFDSTNFLSTDFSATGLAGTFGINANTLTFTVSAIPEPSAYAAILGGLALVGVAARRRSRAS